MNDSPLLSCDARQLGRSLRQWRTLRRLKQGAVGAELGVSQTTVSRWESGIAAPSLDEQQALRRLMAARLDSAADFELGRLVERAPGAVHLICDLSHRLLAMSRGREHHCRLPRSELIGRALWCYATPEIVAQEARLDALGWYEPAPGAVEFDTGASVEQDMPIQPSRMRWVRFQLSDGSFVRLTETIS
ncbi:helix-turn-helix transcriptional regulator [Roseateles chitinivorans]|uniref:helix-turn-helix transcriptional regulator n=1 Tax=Roseateles chitinivorans TaxID=2917965 RepID=UPI003D67FAE7